jgi:hypothetical protein
MPKRKGGKDNRLCNSIKLDDPCYTPERLLHALSQALGQGFDEHLAHALEIEPAQLSRIRHRKQPLTEWVLVQIMDRTDWSIRQVRALAGIPFDGPARVAA